MIQSIFSDFSKGIDGELLKIENVETLIGSRFGDNIISSSASIIYGNDGDDIICGNNAHKSFILGGNGRDVLTAGELGDTLDGNDGEAIFGGNEEILAPSVVYNGGAGADTFVISPGGGEVGTDGRKITYTVINGADSSDRLVLRTALARGEDYSLAVDSDDWRDGIEVKGGVAFYLEEDGPGVYGTFTSYLEMPKIEDDDGYESVIGTENKFVKPDLGDVTMTFQDLMGGSLLIHFWTRADENITGEGKIEVKDYRPGDLGLQFQLHEPRVGNSLSPGEIQETWSSYSNAMLGVINSVNHVELQSPFPADRSL